MPKQPAEKQKAKGPHNRPEDTKKLQKASYQPALNSPPRPASATASSLSQRGTLPSLTSDSSIEGSSSSTANSLVDKSSASTASIEKHSSAPSATRASSASMLQETRPNHSGAQETKELSWREFRTMSSEQLKEYARSRGWKVPPDDELDIEYDSDNDPYQQDLDAWKEGELIWMMEKGQLRFDGQIMWCKGKNTLQWSELKPDATTGKPIKSIKKAVFRESGNPTTNTKCIKEMYLFMNTKQRREQFQLVEKITMDQLWPALVDKFGYPTMEYITK